MTYKILVAGEQVYQSVNFDLAWKRTFEEMQKRDYVLVKLLAPNGHVINTEELRYIIDVQSCPMLAGLRKVPPTLEEVAVEYDLQNSRMTKYSETLHDPFICREGPQYLDFHVRVIARDLEVEEMINELYEMLERPTKTPIFMHMMSSVDSKSRMLDMKVSANVIYVKNITGLGETHKRLGVAPGGLMQGHRYKNKVFEVCIKKEDGELQTFRAKNLEYEGERYWEFDMTEGSDMSADWDYEYNNKCISGEDN